MYENTIFVQRHNFSVTDLLLGTTSIPTFVTQNGQWPLGGVGVWAMAVFRGQSGIFVLTLKKLY